MAVIYAEECRWSKPKPKAPERDLPLFIPPDLLRYAEEGR